MPTWVVRKLFFVHIIKDGIKNAQPRMLWRLGWAKFSNSLGDGVGHLSKKEVTFLVWSFGYISELKICPLIRCPLLPTLVWRWTVRVDEISAKRMNSVRANDNIGKIRSAVVKYNFCAIFIINIINYFNTESCLYLKKINKKLSKKSTFGFFSHSSHNWFIRRFLLATMKLFSRTVPFSSLLRSSSVGLSFPAVILVQWIAWLALFKTWLKFIFSKHNAAPSIEIPAPIGFRIFVDFS